MIVIEVLWGDGRWRAVGGHRTLFPTRDITIARKRMRELKSYYRAMAPSVAPPEFRLACYSRVAVIKEVESCQAASEPAAAGPTAG